MPSRTVGRSATPAIIVFLRAGTNHRWRLSASAKRAALRSDHPRARSQLLRPVRLRAAGDAEQALRLLRWVDGPFLLHSSALYNMMLVPLVDLERGRIEEARGRAEAAAAHYRRFLERYDQAAERHRPLVAEVRGRVGAR